MPSPKAGEPPLVSCPRLFIQYIRTYPPYLEAVSSIRNLRTRHSAVTRDTPDIVSVFYSRIILIHPSSEDPLYNFADIGIVTRFQMFHECFVTNSAGFYLIGTYGVSLRTRHLSRSDIIQTCFSVTPEECAAVACISSSGVLFCS
jgi:hypothetical protein